MLLLPVRLLKRFLQFLWQLLPENVRRLIRLALTAETPSAALDVVKVIISAFGVLAIIFAGVGLYLIYQNSQAERQLNTDRLVTDRFAKAVEQIGSQNIDVRLGGIYSLERIAKDSPKDHWTVMEVLTAYVRNKSPLPKEWIATSIAKRKPLPVVTTDVQSALTVIGRRETNNDSQWKRLDLSNSNLSGADLDRASLIGASLNGANLYRASLDSASLKGASLRGANLYRAFLPNANLYYANLEDADLRGASFYYANFYNASLNGANLYRAILFDATDIAPEQIKQAKNWQKANYDDGFRKQLGLPPEKP